MTEKRNPSMPAAQMRAVGTTQRVIEQWLAYRESTPIAVETFVPLPLCAALDTLAAEVGSGTSDNFGGEGCDDA